MKRCIYWLKVSLYYSKAFLRICIDKQECIIMNEIFLRMEILFFTFSRSFTSVSHFCKTVLLLYCYINSTETIARKYKATIYNEWKHLDTDKLLRLFF